MIRNLFRAQRCALALAAMLAAATANAQLGVGGLRSAGAMGFNESASSLAPIARVSGGQHVTYAVRTDRTVVCWGLDGDGQAEVPYGLTNVKEVEGTYVDLGVGSSLAVKNDGTVVGWGNNQYGQITIPSGLTNVVSVSLGSRHTVALKSDGTVGEITPRVN